MVAKRKRLPVSWSRVRITKQPTVEVIGIVTPVKVDFLWTLTPCENPTSEPYFLIVINGRYVMTNGKKIWIHVQKNVYVDKQCYEYVIAEYSGYEYPIYGIEFIRKAIQKWSKCQSQ